MGLNLLSRILFIAIFAIGSLSSNLAPRQTCSSGYSLCSPPGATGSSTYDIGDGLIHLYANLLDTVNPHAPAPGAQPQPVSPNGPAKRQSVNAMCCASSLSCYLLQGSGVPMCYVSVLLSGLWVSLKAHTRTSSRPTMLSPTVTMALLAMAL